MADLIQTFSKMNVLKQFAWTLLVLALGTLALNGAKSVELTPAGLATFFAPTALLAAIFVTFFRVFRIRTGANRS